MTCTVCKAPSPGTKPCPGYCEGVEDGRDEAWRALLERDIAEVERALPGLRDNARRHLRDGAYAAAAIGAAWLGALVGLSPTQVRALRRSGEVGDTAAEQLDWAKRRGVAGL